MKKILTLGLFLSFLLSSYIILAQRPNFNKYGYSSIGFNINAMNYVGDLDPSPGLFGGGVKFTRQNIGICALHKISPFLSIRGNVSYGKIQASDAGNASYSNNDIYRKTRNLSFQNKIWELKADLIFDLNRFWGKFTKRPDYVPYVFIGVAYFHHNPQALTPQKFGAQWVDLEPMHLEGKSYSLNQIAIPVGIGFRYKLSQYFDLAFELGARFTFTDYLDDVSGSYIGRDKFGDDQLKIAMEDRSMEGLNRDQYLQEWVQNGNGFNNSNGYTTINGYGRAGDQRGNNNRKDWYFVSGFHLTYILKSRVKCPEFSKFR